MKEYKINLNILKKNKNKAHKVQKPKPTSLKPTVRRKHSNDKNPGDEISVHVNYPHECTASVKQ